MRNRIHDAKIFAASVTSSVNNNVDFALSIHFNGFNKESANGTEVFVSYGEEVALIESGFYEELCKYFRDRKPYARSNNYYNRNETFDKMLDSDRGKFLARAEKRDYFGFIRTCWEGGISADLIEICFLTNEGDFELYNRYKEEIVSAVAKSIVEGFGEYYKKPKIKAKKINPRIKINNHAPQIR